MRSVCHFHNSLLSSVQCAPHSFGVEGPLPPLVGRTTSRPGSMAPLWWKILCPVWTRMQSILFHLIPNLKRRLPNIVLGLIFLVLGLGIFLVKIVRQRAGGWPPRRQRDEQSTFRLPRCARRRQSDTQMLLAANLQAIDALYGSRPAPSHYLMRGQPDALLQCHTLPRDRDTGHQDGVPTPLVQKQGLVLFSCLARWNKCWDLRMLSCANRIGKTKLGGSIPHHT